MLHRQASSSPLFLVLVLRAVVLAVVLVFRVALFVFPFVWGSRCSALANETTQLPLVRKHIQRCVRVIARNFWPVETAEMHISQQAKTRTELAMSRPLLVSFGPFRRADCHGESD
jgi:hypothetical protein